MVVIVPPETVVVSEAKTVAEETSSEYPLPVPIPVSAEEASPNAMVVMANAVVDTVAAVANTMMDAVTAVVAMAAVTVPLGASSSSLTPDHMICLIISTIKSDDNK